VEDFDLAAGGLQPATVSWLVRSIFTTRSTVVLKPTMNGGESLSAQWLAVWVFIIAMNICTLLIVSSL
jgi:hypothetical protein